MMCCTKGDSHLLYSDELEEKKALYILREIHEGICENHSEGMTLVHKVLRQGYYWQILKNDAL